MRREFIHSFGEVTSSKPAFLREAYYRRLTGDQSCSSNASEQAIDDRVKLIFVLIMKAIQRSMKLF